VVVTVPSVSYDGQIASLRLEQARLRIAELEVTAAAWQNAADLLEEPVNGDLEKFKSQLRRLQQQARAALVARDEYRGRFLKARMDLRKLRDQVEVRQEAGEATEPTKDLQRHLDAAEISLHVVQADLDDTICDLNATRQKYEKLEAEHRELQRHLDAAEISLHVVQADLDATVCDLNATRQKYEKLEAEHRELQEQHATLSAAVKVDPAALEEARAAVPLLEADRVLRTAADVLFWRCRRLSGVERSLCEAMHLSLVGLLLHVIKSKPTAYPLEAAPDN
jgi:chromosome segregation ATPase